MSHNKLLSRVATAAVLLLILVIAFALTEGASLNDVLAGIFFTTIYVMFIAVSLSRFALIFLGIFAIYKILRDRVNTSDTL